MKRLVGLCGVVFALVAAQGCKSETARKADTAADNVKEQREDLEAAQKDLETERKEIAEQQKDLIEESKDVATQGAELAKAESVFDARRRLRVNALRAEHAIIASQPNLISTMAQHFALTDAGREQVNEKLSRFQMRLDETKNLIEALPRVDAEHWEDRNDAVRDAMDKLDDARDAAWDALEDAPRVDPSAS